MYDLDDFSPPEISTVYADNLRRLCSTGLSNFELLNREYAPRGERFSGDPLTCSMIVKVFNRNPELKSFKLLPNTGIMPPVGWTAETAVAVVNAAASHPTLRMLTVICSGIRGAAQSELLLAIAKLIRTNPRILTIRIEGFQCTVDLEKVSGLVEIYNALRTNWTLTQLTMICACRWSFGRDHWPPTDSNLWKIDRRIAYNMYSCWSDVHEEVLNVAIALRPMGLSSYVLLWILDWHPRCRFLYVHGDDNEYDPYRARKLALIERVSRKL